MTVKDCYQRIYEWHKKYGKTKVKEIYSRDDAYSKAYLDLVDALPSPDEATQADMDFVFGEVIFMLMEWSYHQEDEYGIKISTYAHFALEKQYVHGLYDDQFRESRKESMLFAQFSEWQKKYDENKS